MYNWNDMHVFLAVCEEGSTLGAGRVIGMNQTTVARRIDALEHALGLHLFERDTRGYRPTPQGSALVEVAKRMRAVASEIATSADQLRRDDHGLVRFAGNPEAMQRFGVILVSRFREHNPDIAFEIDIDVHWSEGQLPLETGEADLVLRATDNVEGDTLIVRKLARVPLGVYCSRRYHQQFGAPRTLEECSGHQFFTYTNSVGKVMKAVEWLNSRIDERQVLYQVNAVPSMIAALQTGQAIGLLPCVSGDATTDFVRCFRHEELYHSLWIIASRESYSRPAVRRFMAFAGEQFARHAIEGAE